MTRTRAHGTIRQLGAALAALALAGGVQGASSLRDLDASPASDLRAEPEVQPDRPLPPPARPKRNALDGIPNVSLAAAPSGFFISKSLAPAQPGTPLQVGFGRAVTPLESEASMGERISWQRQPGGEWVGAISVTSPGAAAIRMGLRIGMLPSRSLLRFYAPGSTDVFEVAAADVTATIDRNLLAEEPREVARVYWSPVVEADTIALEIELPPGAEPADAAISAPMISHLVTRASTNFALPKAAASCELDATCYLDSWGAESRTVARIVFTRDGSTFVCSGSLLADKDTATFIPYFLTANHCISSQATASSIQTYWFYRSTGCDTGVRGGYQSLFGGAALLYATSNTDTAFMRLNGTPPAGVGYAGWLAGSPPRTSSAMTGLHHPSGDLQKISFGSLESYWTCTPAAGTQFSCSGAATSSATFFAVSWARGITEPGSSGSPIFLDSGHYLVGQLYGGSDSCTSTANRDWYGRFDVAYNAALYQWLGSTVSSGPAPPPATATPPPISVSPPSAPANYSGLWWNPAESGWGVSVTQHASSVVAAWYLYDATGRATWLVLPAGQWASSSQFTGDLYAATGPDPRGNFNPDAVTRTKVGTATFTFATADSAQLSYSVNGTSETRALRRQAFGVIAPALAANYGDLWWNPAESGWGVSITQQYQTLFAVWYAYGADGQPLWYVLPGGAWIAADTYSGTLYRTAYAPVPFIGKTFDPSAVTRTAVGTLALRFLNADSVVMSWTIDGVAGSKIITRQAF